MTVPPFRPYGGDDIRVVSDLSRFDYQPDQKIRSRNPTPPSTINDNVSSSKLTLDTIIPLYSSKIDERPKYSPLRQQEDRSTQYPSPPIPVKEEPTITIPKREKKKVRYSIGVQVPQDNGGISMTNNPAPPAPVPVPVPAPAPPPPPPKDIAPRLMPYPQDINNANNLPPMPQPTSQLYPQQQLPPLPYKDSSSITSPQKRLEKKLIKQVMNRPVIQFKADRFGQNYEGEYFTISANFVIYVFEVCCSVVEIVLSSILLQRDQDIGVGYYRYFLADGIISLIVSLLFALQVINYEIRNGIFYCLVSTICKFVSFIFIISHIFPHNTYATHEIWQMRRGVGAIIIISTFLWVTNMTMFVTTLYISRLDLLEELNFDYSEVNKTK